MSIVNDLIAAIEGTGNWVYQIETALNQQTTKNTFFALENKYITFVHSFDG